MGTNEGYTGAAHLFQPVAFALVSQLGIDPEHVSADSIKLSPWNSQGHTLVSLELVYIIAATPDEIRAMVEVGQPLPMGDW